MRLVFHRTVVIVKHDKPFAHFLGQWKVVTNSVLEKVFLAPFIGFLRVPGCPRGGGNWGILRVAFGKIGGTLGKIRGITTP